MDLKKKPLPVEKPIDVNKITVPNGYKVVKEAHIDKLSALDDKRKKLMAILSDEEVQKKLPKHLKHEFQMLDDEIKQLEAQEVE